MLAHQGGWDEFLIVLVIASWLWIAMKRSEVKKAPREGTTTTPATEAHPCLYCGHRIDPTDDVCPGCGFRDPGPGRVT